MISTRRVIKCVAGTTSIALVAWIAIVEIHGSITINNDSAVSVIVKAESWRRTRKDGLEHYTPNITSTFPDFELQPGQSRRVFFCRWSEYVEINVSQIEPPQLGSAIVNMSTSGYASWGQSLTINASKEAARCASASATSHLRGFVETLADTASFVRCVL